MSRREVHSPQMTESFQAVPRKQNAVVFLQLKHAMELDMERVTEQNIITIA